MTGPASRNAGSTPELRCEGMEVEVNGEAMNTANSKQVADFLLINWAAVGTKCKGWNKLSSFRVESNKPDQTDMHS